jgi:hypothetical protein
MQHLRQQRRRRWGPAEAPSRSSSRVGVLLIWRCASTWLSQELPVRVAACSCPCMLSVVLRAYGCSCVHSRQPRGCFSHNDPLWRWLQKLFRQLDADGNGSVSMDELAKGLRQQGYVLSDAELEQLVRVLCVLGCIGSEGVMAMGMELGRWGILSNPLHMTHAEGRRDQKADGSLACLLQMPSVPWDQLTMAVAQVRKIDTNSDGTLDLAEFLTTMMDWNCLAKDASWQVRDACIRKFVRNPYLVFHTLLRLASLCRYTLTLPSVLSTGMATGSSRWKSCWRAYRRPRQGLKGWAVGAAPPVHRRSAWQRPS